MRYSFVLLIFISMFVSCCQQEDTSKKMVRYFDSKKDELEKLITAFDTPNIDSILNKDEYKVNIKAEEFPENISKQMRKLGLLNVSAHSDGKRKRRTYIFKTNWISNDSIFLVNNVGDSIETKKGFYGKDKNANEVTGLGNFWQYIKIVKYLN